MFSLAALLPHIARLGALVAGVMQPLGGRVRQRPSNMGQHTLIPEALVLLVQSWLHKRRLTIEALIRRIAAGKHVGRAYFPRAPKPEAIRKRRVEIPPEKQLPPRVFGWIYRMAPQVGLSAAGLIQLVGETEIRAMIEASPQMARLWVPLLNAVGVERPGWWPEPPPRPGRSTSQRTRPRARASLTNGPDPVAAWRARIPPPPPPAPLPPGMETSAPSIPPVPLPWYYERLWPQDHPIWRRFAQAAAPASPQEEHRTERWVRLSTRRIGEI